MSLGRLASRTDPGCLQVVTLQGFANSFGTTVDDFPPDCRELIASTDFRFRILEGEERDQVILDVLKGIESDNQKIGGEKRREAWEKGWSENYHNFCEKGYDLNELIPRFIRLNQVIRLNRQYVMPSNPNFELDYFSVFRLWLFRKYLTDMDAVYEFGCGTGFNLVALAQLYPEKRLYGFDFVPSSRDVVNKIGEVYGWNIRGRLFDMTTPDESVEIAPNSAVLTFGSIEQLAGKFEAFLQFLLKRSPALCISLEPTIELYDEDDLLDYLAVKFHNKRGYTKNYLSRLRELENEGKIEILKTNRLFFGSLYMEGYSYMVWRPKKVKQ